MTRYVIRRAFTTYTPAEFHDYVTSLYKAPDTIPDAKGAPGLRITKTKRGLTFRCTRAEKTVTTLEVTALSIEYQIELETLKEALSKRSFTITNELGEVTNAKPKRSRRGRAAKSDAQRNAHLSDNQRQAASADQLLVTQLDSDLPEKSTLQPELGTEST